VGVAVATLVSVLVVAFLVTGVLQARRVVAERDRANTEASVAKAVTDFLTNDVLAQASPGAQVATKAPDPNLTVRTALDRAAASVDRTFVNQPVVEAAVRGTIGKAYADLGLFSEAEKQLKVAVELRKRVLGESHADTLALMNILGDLYRQQARYAEAEPLLRAVVAPPTRGWMP
jgi:tetratricopeptide (TPR) repeat protein